MVSSGQMPKQGWGSRREAGVRRVGKEEGSERQSRQTNTGEDKRGEWEEKERDKERNKGTRKENDICQLKKH